MHNHALAKKRGGGLGIGVAIRQWRTTDIGRLLAPLGVDWVNIDMEHGTVDLDLAAQMAIACQDAGVTPLVRVTNIIMPAACSTAAPWVSFSRMWIPPRWHAGW